MITSYVPSSSSIRITLTVAGCSMMSGLATDAIMVKVSLSSATVSPSIVTCWHVELPTGVVGGILSVWLTSGRKSPESEANRETSKMCYTRKQIKYHYLRILYSNISIMYTAIYGYM